MNDINTTRMFLTAAVLAAVAALIAGPAQARLQDVEGGGTATSAGSSVPAGAERSVGLTGDSARTRVDRTAVAVDNTLDPAIRAAIAAHQSEQSAAQAKPGDPGTIPYLSHGVGVDESLFAVGPDSSQPELSGVHAALLPHGIGVDESLTGQQPSIGLTGDSPRTRGAMPTSSTTQTVSSGDDFDWTWVGVGGGLAALLAAAMGAFYLSARHRGRIALP